MILLFFIAYTNLFPSQIDSLIIQGLSYSYLQDYKRASETFEKIKELAPDNPAGYFFTAALWQLYMVDFNLPSKEDIFYSNMDKAISLSKEIIKREPDNPYGYFYLGTAYIYRFTYEGWRERYWRAYRNGSRGVKELKRCLKIKPDLYDAYLGLGTYEYFGSRANRYVGGIKLFGDPEKGIRELRLAAEKGRYFNITAQHSLSWALTQEKRPEQAEPYTLRLLERYPKNRIFRWQLSQIYIEEKRYKKAIEVLRDYLDEIVKNYPWALSNIAHSKTHLAKAYLGLGDYNRALELCREVQKFKGKEKGFIGIDDCLKDCSKIIKECRSRLKTTF